VSGRRSIQPRETACWITFHPTTLHVMQAIEDHAEEGYSMTWAKLAALLGLSVRQLYRHIAILDRVCYIDRGSHFGNTTAMMSVYEDYGDECEERT